MLLINYFYKLFRKLFKSYHIIKNIEIVFNKNE